MSNMWMSFAAGWPWQSTSTNLPFVTTVVFGRIRTPRRRCGVCGRFASVVVSTEDGRQLAWHHSECARRLGMAAVR